MMKNSLIIILGVIFFGCNSKEKPVNDLEKVFTDLKEDEYWGVYYQNDECFKFNGYYRKFFLDGTYKKYKWTDMAKDLKQIVLRQNYGK